MSTQTDTNRSVILLSRALDQAGDVLAMVHEQDLDRPTPCDDWDVGALAGHLMATPGNFLIVARGEQPDWAAPPPQPAGSFVTDFRSSADDLIHHWHQELSRDDVDAGRADWQTAEFAQHAWDLTRALGRPTDALDEEVAEQGLAFMQRALTPDLRGDAFGPEQPAPRGASAPDRLAAYAGRSV